MVAFARVLTEAADSPVPKCDTSESSWPPGAKEKCSWEASASISYVNSGRYTLNKYIQFCASEACMSVIAAMKATNPSECVTTIEAHTITSSETTLPPFRVAETSTFLYADITTPIEKGCELVNAPSTVASTAPPPAPPAVATPLPSRRPESIRPSTRQPTTATSGKAAVNTTSSAHTDESTASQSTGAGATLGALTSDLPETGSSSVPPTSSASTLSPSGSGSHSSGAESISPTRPRGGGRSSTVSTSEASTASISPTLVALLVGGTFVLLIGAIALYVRRRRRQRISKSDGDGNWSTDTTRESASTFNRRHAPGSTINDHDAFMLLKPLITWRIDSTELKDISLIGGGGQGAVYLVRLNTSRLLASKRLIPTQANQQRLATLVAEAQLVAMLQHTSIVAFVGVAWTTPSSLQVLFEYMANGDLRGHLDDTKPPDQQSTAWTREKLQIAFQVAGGLVYAHSFMPPVVHRNLKARNILLDDDMNAKISDFGVARSQSEEGTMTTGIGSSRWLSPEVITGGGDYTERCDIYAFGVLMTELDTHELPYTESSLSEVLLMKQVVQNDIRPRVSEACDPVISELIQQCLLADPLNRPNALELSFRLRQILKSK